MTLHQGQGYQMSRYAMDKSTVMTSLNAIAYILSQGMAIIVQVKQLSSLKRSCDLIGLSKDYRLSSQQI